MWQLPLSGDKWQGQEHVGGIAEAQRTHRVEAEPTEPGSCREAAVKGVGSGRCRAECILLPHQIP